MKDNNTGKNSDFYALGKKMFDRLNPTGPATHNFYQDKDQMLGLAVRITQDVTQIPQEDSSKRQPLTDDLYYELLFAVGNKYPDETRHQTALRYIKQAEMSSAGPAKDAHGIKEKNHD